MFHSLEDIEVRFFQNNGKYITQSYRIVIFLQRSRDEIIIFLRETFSV